MARDAVAEVDGPRKPGGSAVGVVGETGEEAADAADGDAEGERNGVEIAGGLSNADVALHEFDGDQAEDQSADDGLSTHEVGGVVETVPGKLGVLEPEQKFGAKRSAGDGSGYYGPADCSGYGIAKATAEQEIDKEGDDVGESLEKEVRADA